MERLIATLVICGKDATTYIPERNEPHLQFQLDAYSDVHVGIG